MCSISSGRTAQIESVGGTPFYKTPGQRFAREPEPRGVVHCMPQSAQSLPGGGEFYCIARNLCHLQGRGGGKARSNVPKERGSSMRAGARIGIDGGCARSMPPFRACRALERIGGFSVAPPCSAGCSAWSCARCRSSVPRQPSHAARLGPAPRPASTSSRRSPRRPVARRAPVARVVPHADYSVPLAARPAPRAG